MTTDIRTAEVAKLAKTELRRKFPGVKFSVRSKIYSGGSSITVEWDDGPGEKQVEDCIGHFHGAEFDGMQDLKIYNGQPYANDFIFCNRHISDTHYRAEGQRLIDLYGLPVTVDDLDRSVEVIWDKFRHWTLRQVAWQQLKDRELAS